ncbi:putative transmembrane protein [Senna tora]|uniref:Putative transmembrane protein n=1 Tax=Senna tora TaxID=362788 RepID=A0A834WBC8_9FABA|nr:putative transmembrane protein [Senna tora]
MEIQDTSSRWDKFQSLVPCCAFLFNLIQPDSSPSHHHHHLQKPEFPFVMTKQSEIERLPVLMPGDKVPKFIAMACPCHPPRDHEAVTVIEMPKPHN